MVLRASSISRIMGNFPDYPMYRIKFEEVKIILYDKLISKPFVPEEFESSSDIEKHDYLKNTGYFESPPYGTKKEFNNYQKWYEKLNTLDELSDGAKNYLHDMFLQKNGLSLDITSFAEFSATQKGNIMEEQAIELVNEVELTEYNKNVNRVYYDIIKKEYHISTPEEPFYPDVDSYYLSGECDIYAVNLVRDIKCPQDMKSFLRHSNKGISTNYHWQLISYCLLWKCKQACIDFCLMPTPYEVYKGWSEVNQKEVKRFNENVLKLNNNRRLKTFFIDEDIILKDLNKLLQRLVLAVEYYDSLTIEKLLENKFNYTDE